MLNETGSDVVVIFDQEDGEVSTELQVGASTVCFTTVVVHLDDDASSSLVSFPFECSVRSETCSYKSSAGSPSLPAMNYFEEILCVVPSFDLSV